MSTPDVQPTRPPERWERGEKLLASKLNQVVDAVGQLTPAVQPPRQVVGTAVPIIKMVEVCAEYDDYISAYELTVSQARVTPDSLIFVAKPRLLRRSVYEAGARAGSSFTYATASTRTATYGTYTETQEIVPLYVAGTTAARGDIIEVMSGIVGYPLTLYHGPSATPTSTVTVSWLDITPRFWGRTDA